jgi:hypothetical protein
MIPLPTGVRVWLATGYADMRNYAERTIMRSPRRQVVAGRGFLDGITPHNSACAPPC